MNVSPHAFGRAEALDKVLFHSADDAESSIIRQGRAYWDSLRGGRKFPERAEVTLRGLGRLARYTVLVRVIDSGNDYEYRFIGNVPVSAIGFDFQGRRMSDPEVNAVMSANYRHQLYDQVVRTGEPWVFKCRMVDDLGLKLPAHSETAYLPLGQNDVDHLLGFTVFSTEQMP